MSRPAFTTEAGQDYVLPADAARAVGRFAASEPCVGYKASNLLDAPLRHTRAAAEDDYRAGRCVPAEMRRGELRHIRSNVNDEGVNSVELLDDVNRYTVRDDGSVVTRRRDVTSSRTEKLAHVNVQRRKGVEALIAAAACDGQALANNLQRDAADTISAIMHLFGHDGAEVLQLAQLQYQAELV
jgi:hypothetical protein